MVIGQGLIGRRFQDYQQNDALLIFASGVSNSNCTSTELFEREAALLQQQQGLHGDKRLVYFSTCSILDKSQLHSPYVQHKIALEKWIQQHCNQYTIFRISNPVGKTENPHTFFNYFVQHILANNAFDIWKFATRNILDVDDMYKICNHIIGNNLFQQDIVNVANITNYAVLDIVEAIEQHFKVSGNYKVVNRGNSPLIDTTPIHDIIDLLQIDFAHNYIERILQKYF